MGLGAGEVAGAALGATFGELLGAVSKEKNHARQFKPGMMKLQQALKELAPKIKEIEALNTQEGRPDQSEIEGICEWMEEGKKLVRKCSHVGWWKFWQKSHYHKQLLKLENKLLWLHISLQACILKEVKHINSKLGDLIRSLQHQRRRRPFRLFRRRHEAAEHLAELSCSEISVVHPTDADTLNTPNSVMFSRCSEYTYMCYDVDSSEHLWSDDECLEDDLSIKYFGGDLDDDEQLRDDLSFKYLGADLDDDEQLKVAIELNKGLDLDELDHKETESITRLMGEGEKLVRKYSNEGCWNLPLKWLHQKKLLELQNELLRFHSIYLQARKARDHPTTSTSNSSEMHKE